MKRYLSVAFFILFFQALSAQDVAINPDLLVKGWDAHWLSPPATSLKDYGVYHFRHDFTLPAKPGSFIIHVTADNRYRLFVNGQPVGFGPARGDLLHWPFESYDIAPYLQSGQNCLAAVVWNFGEHAPVAQHTYLTGFLLQGNTAQEHRVNTHPETWKVLKNESYAPLTQADFTVFGYYAVGATDQVDGKNYPWGWEKPGFDTEAWEQPLSLRNGQPYGFPYGYGDGAYNLVPRNIPMMEEHPERLQKIVSTEGASVDTSFLAGNQPVTIPAHTQVRLLLDQTYLVSGYPELLVSKGKGSQIRITYSEALYDAQNQKGNRNITEGKKIEGYFDLFTPDGGAERLFRPLWNRTYRFVELAIETQEEPLILEDFYGIYTTYPFEEKGSFQSSDAVTEDIWNVGWRTARLCATETYMDCPYYEQLQYIGDTRIQALISLYVSGDDRLMRNSLLQFDHSRMPEGITMSRYPSGLAQYIPPYSLFWIAMVHDYHMYREDAAFIQQLLPGIQAVLQWFESRLDTNQLLTGLLWWNYVDAVEGFNRGTPPGAEEGHSTLITLQLVYALDYAAELFEAYGSKEMAQHYQQLSTRIKQAVVASSYDESRKLIADTPQKNVFSQHANIMAVLTNTLPEEDQRALIERTLADTSLVQCNIYYRFYLTRALQKVGMADYFIDHLETWTDMLEEGLTTFAEHEEDTRSDCHAWSASPNYEFLATVCGIRSAAPHFASVEIAPALGHLDNVEGSMPHPLGMVQVRLQKKGKNKLTGTIVLPEGLSGYLRWHEQKIPLKPGSQNINAGS